MRPLPLLLLLLAAPLAWAAPPGVTVSWTPARVVLGQDTRVTVVVRVPAGSGPVRGAASSGTFAQERMEGGEVRAFEWTPPSVRYPLVAVLAFWLEGGAEASAAKPLEWAAVRIPLLGKTQLDVSTAAGASVVVEVGDTRFGPVQADDRGRARVPVEVPPGVRSASVLATRETLRTRATIPLDPPQEVPLIAALAPSPLPVREGGWLLVDGEEGLRADALELSVEGATLSDDEGRRTDAPVVPSVGETPSAVEGAPLRYRVTPAQDATAVTVTVRRKGHEDRARAVAEVTRVPVVVPPPAPEPRPETPTPAPRMAGPWRPSVFVLVGGAIASGANTGPAGAVGISLSPPWWGGRFAAELEAGLRSATFDGRVDSLGVVRSRVLAVPVLASVRGVIFQRAAFSLYGRAGGGVLPFQHQLRSDFQEDLKESKLAGMGFLSLQGAYRLGRWSALAEARGAWAPARTPWLDAQLGGLSGLLGVRFDP
ncbi:hypothetical protein [Pyxidicoccus sp. MSG2]|uniref:hypothetical protein n=1 Tax=Pyxidicoccus sp. MSG2 TaxID=2996790 RepID=UPI00226DF72F|nr:hypothetical protein [Pyxidicoccus sp. MSG2]MCY1023130.1 hypothetical protein [Pyxidicoccus sp. MSG2]